MLQSYSVNLALAACSYAKKLGIPVTEKTLKTSLIDNPHYPSLLSLNNVFNKLNIPNQAFKLEDSQFDELEAPFITYLTQRQTGKDFVLVTKVSKDKVSYVENGNKTITVAKENFLQLWEKIAFVAERSPQSGEINFENNKLQENKAHIKKASLFTCFLVVVLAACFIFLKATSGHTIAALLILIIKLTGLTATILLLIYEIDKSNSFVKHICKAGKQLNCDAVLKSKASKIAGISWGEAGFFYFAASTLFLLWPGIVLPAKTAWIAVANALAAPYIIFSIYYQWRVVKQWCPLCLGVQAVLAMELTWSLINFWQTPLWPVVSFNIFSVILLVILTPIVIWYSLKPVFIKLKTERGYKTAYKRLLYSPQIFNGLLQQEKTAAPGYENLGIMLGNPQAANTIIKVCNPYCGPCAMAHPVLEEILDNKSNVKVQIIFTNANAASDKGTPVVKHLLAIAAQGNATQTRQALDDWYLPEKKDYDLFAAKHPMNGEIKKQDEKVEAMHSWCRKAGIQFTPTLFINGKQLPETYRVQELKHIL